MWRVRAAGMFRGVCGWNCRGGGCPGVVFVHLGWRRELRIPSLGARADGYATAPSECTAKAADSLLAKPRLVVWSRTTSLPPCLLPYPPRCSLRQAHTAHVKVTPSPFSRDSLPESWKRRASPWYTAAGKGTENMAFSRRRMPSTVRLLQLAHLLNST